MSKPKTTSYVFIPGKNWKLSLAELLSFLEAKTYDSRITDLSKSHFTFAGEELPTDSCIDELGGIIKIGRIITCIPSGTIIEAFLHAKEEARTEIKSKLSSDPAFEEIFRVSPEKRVFGVSSYFENPSFRRVSKIAQRFLGNHIKKAFAVHGIKARFMGFPKKRKLPQLTNVEVLKKELIEKSVEILLCIGEKQTIIAKTMAIHNPFEFQKRDIGRPVQRKIFSIPPRLARIMVNLSLCSHGKVLLDPFCGVGTFLQEAVLTKAQAIGVDVNPWCVEASNKNLEWLKSEYGLINARYRVKLGNTRKLTEQVSEETVDCITTEPDLGPALRHIPTVHYASRIVDALKPLYYGFLGEAYKVLKNGGRLVFVSPYVRTRVGDFITLDVEERARALGFRVVPLFRKEAFAEDHRLVRSLVETEGLIEIGKRHKIGRRIHVLQK